LRSTALLQLLSASPFPLPHRRSDMRTFRSVLALTFAALLTFARTASAQTIGGEVDEAMTAQPLRSYQVRLFYLAQGDTTQACDSTTTDERGLFQFGGQGAGPYRIEFGPPDSRLTSSARVEASTPDTMIAVRFRVPVLELGGAQAFSEKEVQKVALGHSLVQLRYPEELRRASVTGEVVVRFIVDPTGSVRLGSVKVVRSSHPLFTRAVTDFLRTMKFYPAAIGGIPVPQLVEEPFTFSIEHEVVPY
jgi:TonB family protein